MSFPWWRSRKFQDDFEKNKMISLKRPASFSGLSKEQQIKSFPLTKYYKRRICKWDWRSFFQSWLEFWKEEGRTFIVDVHCISHTKIRSTSSSTLSSLRLCAVSMYSQFILSFVSDSHRSFFTSNHVSSISVFFCLSRMGNLSIQHVFE